MHILTALAVGAFAGGGIVFWFTERAKATAIAAAISAEVEKAKAEKAKLAADVNAAAAKIEKAV